MTERHRFTKDDAIRFADEHSGLFGEHSKLSCEELSGSNLSVMFRVSNDKGSSLIVKQALQNAHIGNENWLLTPDRARIEAEVLIKHRKLCPEHTIEVLHYDVEHAAILLEDLKDYRILRSELIAGKQFAHLAPQLAAHFARTLYFTSDFALTGPNKKQLVSHFLNPELCLVTEDLFFTDPYCNHERNNVHAEISADAQQLWHDDVLQAEVAKLKADFLSKPQALLHGNLNTSNILINDDNCKLIDAEFGFCGPMGFDIGTLIANLLLNYIAHFGLTTDETLRQKQQQYLLNQVDILWQQFSEQFKQLLDTECRELSLQNSLYQQYFLQQVFADSLGYAGCELIRRVVGLAHLADVEQIEDESLRAKSERTAITLGRELILQRYSLANIEQVLMLVKYFKS